MLAALIGLAIGWAIKATLLDGPISFWKAFGIGVLVMLPLLAAIPDSSFAPIVGGAIALALSTGYTGKSRKKSNTINKARTASSKRLHPQKPNLKQSTQPKKKEPIKTEKPQMSSAHNDEKFFEQVAAELEEGSRKKGLWLKAETKAGGDEDKARLLYIEWRVEQLAEAEDEARRQKEEAELEKELPASEGREFQKQGESNVERINREYDEEKRKGRSDPNDL
jgi:hypothetical protein